MQVMGVYKIYPKLNLSKRYHAQYVRLYLLRNLPIARSNQAWGVEINYIRMEKGFMYLFSILVIDFELSSTLEKIFYCDM